MWRRAPLSARRRIPSILRRPGRASHRLEDFLLGDVGRHDLVPVGVARQPLFAGPDRVVARAGAGGIAAVLNRHDRLAQHAPRLPDRLVARAEVFLRAVDDRPYAFLQRAVLLVDAVDPGVALGALHFAVEPVIV